MDVRPFKKSANIEAVDVAKRLQDYGRLSYMEIPYPAKLEGFVFAFCSNSTRSVQVYFNVTTNFELGVADD